MKKYDAVIIGAGPSGMTAALEISKLAPHFDILILEKNAVIGKKLKATGNGKCNITNIHAEGYSDAKAFLEELGIVLRTNENGLVYPYSESAADVVSVFDSRLAEFGVEVCLSAEVTSVEKTDATGDFEVKFNLGGGKDNKNFKRCKVSANNVVLATGGKAGPGFGTIGDGYRMTRAFGHDVISPIPILTSINCDINLMKSLAGIRAKGKVKLFKNDAEIFAEAGEVQFTKTGLSGICIFNTTRHMRFEKGDSIDSFKIKIDLFEGDMKKYLESRRAIERNLSKSKQNGFTEELLRTVVKEGLAKEILKRAEVGLKPIAELSDDEISRIATHVHGLEFAPTGIAGWKEAQCTAGGVALAEISESTNESKLVSGLYITGELADFDGPCGGYNLTYAWNSGLRAGRAIASSAAK